tara:strand:+ start:104 stop:295 length:192 start_codon:yes stop_codon:yes gene_type:complete
MPSQWEAVVLEDNNLELQEPNQGLMVKILLFRHSLQQEAEEAVPTTLTENKVALEAALGQEQV